MFYVNGDSFSYGIGIAIDEPEKEDMHKIIKEKRFSKLLCDKIGMVEHNASVPGSCNTRIARRAFIDILLLKPKFVMITWSDPSRFEFTDYKSTPLRYDEDATQLRVSSIKFDPIGAPAKRAMKEYYANLSSPYSDVMHTYQHMASIDYLCRSLDIPCLQLWFRDSCTTYWVEKCTESGRASYQRTMVQLTDFLKENDMNRIWTQEDSFESLCEHNMCEVDDHPNELGHELLAQWLEENYFNK